MFSWLKRLFGIKPKKQVTWNDVPRVVPPMPRVRPPKAESTDLPTTPPQTLYGVPVNLPRVRPNSGSIEPDQPWPRHNNRGIQPARLTKTNPQWPFPPTTAPAPRPRRYLDMSAYPIDDDTYLRHYNDNGHGRHVPIGEFVDNELFKPGLPPSPYELQIPDAPEKVLFPAPSPTLEPPPRHEPAPTPPSNDSFSMGWNDPTAPSPAPSPSSYDSGSSSSSDSGSSSSNDW